MEAIVVGLCLNKFLLRKMKSYPLYIPVFPFYMGPWEMDTSNMFLTRFENPKQPHHFWSLHRYKCCSDLCWSFVSKSRGLFIWKHSSLTFQFQSVCSSIQSIPVWQRIDKYVFLRYGRKSTTFITKNIWCSQGLRFYFKRSHYFWSVFLSPD